MKWQCTALYLFKAYIPAKREVEVTPTVDPNQLHNIVRTILYLCRESS